MATGVTVTTDTINLFNEFKKSSNPLRFVTAVIDDGKIVTADTSESKSFEDFIAHFKPTECKYALYKCAYITKDGRDAEKIVSITW